MRNVWWEELKKLAEGSGGKRGRHDLSLEVLSRYEPQTTPGIHLGILAPTVPCNREAVRDSQRINVTYQALADRPWQSVLLLGPCEVCLALHEAHTWQSDAQFQTGQ